MALTDGSLAVLPELAGVGVTELVVVGAPPADPDAVGAWVTELAARWGAGDV